MTFLPLFELDRRRAEGTSPKGGPAGDFSEISGSLSLDPHQRLDALLHIQWEHPLDDSVMAAIRGVAGNHSRSTILIAAEVVRDRAKSVGSREVAVNAYTALVAGLNVRWARTSTT
jgi:hypothetical protein